MFHQLTVFVVLTLVCCVVGSQQPSHCKEKPADHGKCDCCPPPCCCKCESSTESCESSFDLAFILDGSGSIEDPDWQKLKNFLVSLVQQFKGIGTSQRVAAVKFSSMVRVEWNLASAIAQNKGDLIDALKGLVQPKGTTNIAEALKVTATNVFNAAAGDSPARENIAIIFTDGKGSKNTERLVQYATMLQQATTKVIAIGIADAVEAELNIIATDPNSANVFEIDEFKDLKKILDALGKAICPQGECYCCCPPPWKLWRQYW